MKTILTALLVLGASSAFAADDLSPLGLSQACEAKLQKNVVAKCNADSKDDESREHSCLYSESSIVRNSSDAAYFTIDFTVTDADVYEYGVEITNKTKCDFKVFSKN